MNHRLLILFAAAMGWRCNFDEVCRDRTQKQLQNVNGAIEVYRGTHGRYPDSLVELVKPRDATRPVLGRIPRDGWGRALLYRHPSAHADVGYDLFSAGKDGIAVTADDIAIKDAGAFWLHPQVAAEE